MKTYKVFVNEQQYGFYRIKANNKAHAEKIYNEGLQEGDMILKNGECTVESVEVDTDIMGSFDKNGDTV